jgi:two-component system phosphate regulon sensor histidine kinase PhoR
MGLLVVYVVTVRQIEENSLRTAFAQLDSLMKLARARPPVLEDPVELESWKSWVARGGARVTVVAADGTVLTDSDEDPARMENHANRPEIQDALASGEGRATRFSETVDRDLVYLAVRYRAEGQSPFVLRLALPLEQVQDTITEVRRPIATVSLVVLLLGSIFSLLFARSFSGRVERLKSFSRRVAEGDFEPLPVSKIGDELGELTEALNETAGRFDRSIRKLTEDRNRWTAILSSMSEGIVLVGPDERILFCNQAFKQALSVGGGDLTGRSLAVVTRQPAISEYTRAAVSKGQVVEGEIIVAGVRPRHLLVRVAPVQSETSTGAVVVLLDLTEIRRLERVRRDFVANVSHELKTPLTAIQGFAETLLGGALEDAKNSRRFVNIIMSHAERLGRLTDDLLKLARIEAGKMDIEPRPLSVPDLVGPCLEIARAKARAKRLTFRESYSEHLPLVSGDSDALAEVIQNLLDNAIQYTPAEGEIAISGDTVGEKVRISVSDTGIGIAREHQERIFERFFRVDDARSKEVGGTGLGLAIAKHLVELNGGRIEVESEPGHGSTFKVFLPIAYPPKPR